MNVNQKGMDTAFYLEDGTQHMSRPKTTINIHAFAFLDDEGCFEQEDE
jgi:hypothetical protein